MMEIVKKIEIIKKADSFIEFRVLKNFRWGGFTTEIGQVLSLKEPHATAMVLAGKVEPIFPDIIECMCLGDLRLPGRDAAHIAKKNDRVLLKKDMALQLMLARSVLPVDPNTWRPYNMRLKSTTNQGRAKRSNPVRFEAPLIKSPRDQGKPVQVLITSPVALKFPGSEGYVDFVKGDTVSVHPKLAEEMIEKGKATGA